MNVFDNREAKAMLIATQQCPFNSPDYIYEIKFDGIRCLAYIDKDYVDLRNKRNKQVNIHYPELYTLYSQVQAKCILDGEIIISVSGKPDFYKIQARALTTNAFKIELASKQFPASFVVYDILYYQDHETIDLPLIERKQLLQQVVKENQYIAISMFVEEKGKELFELTKQQGLEGIIAKRKDSKYFYDKRTKDWIKCKHLEEDDYVICGYVPKQDHFISLIIAQYNDVQELLYKGHVTLGSSMQKIMEQNPTIIDYCPFKEIPKGNEEAIWFAPTLVGIVEYMSSNENGLRQPIFKGFRDDKLPQDCKVKGA